MNRIIEFEAAKEDTLRSIDKTLKRIEHILLRMEDRLKKGNGKKTIPNYLPYQENEQQKNNHEG